MATSLTPEQLARLHLEGRVHAAAEGPFINPRMVVRAEKILAVRGEQWAASVLMRELSRRSLMSSHYPWFEDGELQTLILADAAEWELMENSLES